jgi:flagellar biosynthetic protein FliQ
MTPAGTHDWSRHALELALVLGAPMLLSALVVGLVVNVCQTLTQLHEPVVSLIPRLVAVAIVVLLVLPWMLGHWITFTTDLIASIPRLLSRS